MVVFIPFYGFIPITLSSELRLQKEGLWSGYLEKKKKKKKKKVRRILKYNRVLYVIRHGPYKPILSNHNSESELYGPWFDKRAWTCVNIIRNTSQV